MTEMHDRRPPMPVSEEEGSFLPPPRCAVETADVQAEQTPLHDAAIDGDVKKVRAWLDLGADVNAQNWHGNTPLHIASREGKADVVRLLRGAGADETSVNSLGHTPRDYAKDEAVKAALEEPRRQTGIRPETKLPETSPWEGFWLDNGRVEGTKTDGPFPFLLAIGCLIAMVGCGAMAASFLASGGWAAWLVAAKWGSGMAAAGVGMGKILTTTEDMKAKWEKRTAMSSRERKLMAAVEEGNLPHVKKCLAEGFNPNGCGLGHPLHEAVKKENIEVIRELLAYGADPNAKDAEGYTPVFRAVLARKGELVKALLASRHADLDVPNNDGQTAREFMHLVEDNRTPEARMTEEFMAEVRDFMTEMRGGEKAASKLHVPTPKRMGPQPPAPKPL